MIKVFISQPMRGKSDEEIKLVRCILERIAQKKLNNEAEIVDSYFEEYPCAKGHKNIAIKFLAKSIDKLADSDVFLLFRDNHASTTRGCDIEFKCARDYGLIIHCVDNNDLFAYATDKEVEALNRYYSSGYSSCDKDCDIVTRR